jgi:hypothetical protein
MKGFAFRRIVLAAVVAGGLAAGAPALAGDMAEQAAEAESLLSAGKPAEALAAADKAVDAFWTASPLQLRQALFAAKVDGFANYEPRADQPFHVGDELLVYLEPLGYAFTADGDGFKSALAADIEIRTPGGITLAKSQDFSRLEWSGRSRLHEVHATLRFPLPSLKAGTYELRLTLRDQGSDKSTTATLPFSVE